MLITLLCLSVPVTLGFLGYGLFMKLEEWVIYAVITMAAGFACGIFVLLVGSWVKCPLCMMPPLQKRGCAKHRTARTLLGSHRLQVALSVIFRGYFRCPYCGEPTTMEVREHGRRKR